VQAGASPWGWITALILAIVVGFMIGRTSGEAWWMVMVILLVVVAATAAYETGRRSGGRP
jgi:CDP-diglyceride synthetase